MIWRPALIAAGLILGAAAPVPVATVPDEHRLIEGVATDGRTIWVSSVLDSQLLVFNGKGMRRLPLPDGTARPLGIAWDARHNWLWVTTDRPKIADIKPCDSGALIAVDRAGKRHRSLQPGRSFHPGDVSVDPRAVFVSDSSNGAIYRVTMDGRRLSQVFAGGARMSAQGSALDAGGQLIAADYGGGVVKIDPATSVRTVLLRASGRPVVGVDGMVRVGRDYYAIRNGTSPVALIHFRVSIDTIESEPLIEDGLLTDPTQLAVQGRRLLIVANAGWAALDKPDGPPRGPTTILALPLPR